ncbi:MAG TPA: translation initiation factor IF-2 [Acidobacteriota bacterium]|nr:translation initiation factor IF-2 [Acidobacteriota bacterium]
MEQVKVKELASEFDIKNTVVISELKKIGVWVPSADTPVDTDIANRIRKRLQMMVEAELEEKEKKTEKKPKKAAPSKVRRSIKELGKPRKRAGASKAVEEAPEIPELESPLTTGSLRPRKVKRPTVRRKVEAEAEEAPKKVEVSIDDEPLIERVEAQASAELLEKQQVPAPAELEAEAQKAAGAQAPAAKTEAAEAAKEGKAPAAKVPQKAAAKPPVREAPLRPIRRKAATPVQPVRKEPIAEKAKPAAPQPVDRAKPKEAPKPIVPREVTFSEKVTVKLLAEKTGIRSNEIISFLMQKGIMAGINQVLDESVVEAICEQFGLIPEFVSFEEEAAKQEKIEDRPEDLVVRAPVLTVMGHVDHGKTTLLDYIRKTKVAEGEAGGITQHIGAYHVETAGRRVVFIDTPGHEAFTRMRARGAQATDIVILVVAADDGVMPQTREAIDHARAAEVPIIVAINKIDKPDAQPQRVKQELSDLNLAPEDWGGETVMVEVSAIDGTNVDLLLEMILLVSDLLELRANPLRGASGVILEAKLEKGRGSVATILVQNGTLRIGDNFIAGSSFGKVRAMFDDRGNQIREAGPSSGVELLGLQGMPQAGDVFQVVEDAGSAREIVEFRQERHREQELSKSSKVSLEELYAQLQAGEVKELAVVLKADALGSVEVLEETLQNLSSGKVRINVIHKGVGAVSESDVLLASASNAIVIGFNVRPETKAQNLAEGEEVEVRLYSVIYDVASDVQQAMLGLLEPTIQEKYLGRAEVRETFRVPRFGTVGGCYVQDGIIQRNAHARLLRDGVVVYEGKLDSLKRFKDDVNEVKQGYECGLSIANFNDIKVGDVVEIFVKEEVAPELS